MQPECHPLSSRKLSEIARPTCQGRNVAVSGETRFGSAVYSLRQKPVTTLTRKEPPLNTIVSIAQVVVALGILNVWILRFGKATSWRGGEAANMQEEFSVYGLPDWFMYTIGFLKISLAALLIVGLWVPALTKPAATGMAVLMIGAIAMHFKVGDAPLKSLPAFVVLSLCALVAFA